ncbi:MAG: hypothetical protein HY700_04015 [Gemmatimonadetes bacterium]|nr:hypothetical protein [Gemmatimonadota bacterium]
MASKAARVVVLHSAEVHRASMGDRVLARVKLERPSRGFYIGTAELGQAPAGDLRCSAEAALHALSQAVGHVTPVRFELRDVETFEAFGKEAVMVCLTVTIEHQSRTLMGFCPVGEDRAKAAARAVLDATNRLLGVG